MQFETLIFLQILVMGKPLTKYRTHTKLKDEPLHDNEKQTSTTEHEKSQVRFQQFGSVFHFPNALTYSLYQTE